MVLVLENAEDVNKLKSILSEVFKDELKVLKDVVVPEKDKILSTSDLALKFQVTTETIQDWVKAGKISGFRMGGRLYFLESSIMDEMKAISVKRKRR